MLFISYNYSVYRKLLFLNVLKLVFKIGLKLCVFVYVKHKRNELFNTLKSYILKHLRILKILNSHNKNNDCASDTDDLYNFLKMILTMLIQRTLLNPTIPRHNSPDSIKSLIVQIHKMKLFCPAKN